MICQALLVIAIIIIAWFLARLPTLSENPRIRLFRGLAYGCVSGILSAHSLLVAKSAVELLVRTIVDRINQFNRWQSWAILLGLITLALTQLYFLHRGLKLVSTSVLYPLVFCIYNIIAILDGLIYFKQTDRLSRLHAGLIALGTAILLSGVLALSWRLNDEQTQPAVTQSALAPGLGFVEDTDNDDSCDSTLNIDEEAAQALLSGEPMTPTTKLDAVLGATRKVRKTVRLTEADEIWSELHDDSPQPSPNKLVRRASTSNSAHPQDNNEVINERTSLLPQRSVTTPAPSNRRRRSTGFPGFTARPQRRKSSRHSGHGHQDALGGFWKMRWWRDKRKGSGKGPPDPPPPSDQGGPSSIV